MVDAGHADSEPRSHSHRLAELYRDAARALYLGLGVNLVLAVVKVTAGLISGSFALLADAVNSVGDVATTLAVLYAFRVAQRPPDAEHPYGHTRAEAVAASNMAMLVFLSALLIGWEALQRITAADAVPPTWVLAVAGGNFVIKEALYQYKSRVGRRTGSAAVVANAWDHRGDALCSLAVLIGLSFVTFGGPAYSWADETAALIVVAVVATTALLLFRRSASELLDSQADDEMITAVRATSDAVPGVADTEKLLVRKSGLEYFVDIHVEVNPTMTVAEGHEIGHAVKDAILDEHPTVRDVLVHLEPHPHDARSHRPADDAKPDDASGAPAQKP